MEERLAQALREVDWEQGYEPLAAALLAAPSLRGLRELDEENAKLRAALERALMQWEMYAEEARYGATWESRGGSTGDDYPSIASATDAEAVLFQEARAALVRGAISPEAPKP